METGGWLLTLVTLANCCLVLYARHLLKETVKMRNLTHDMCENFLSNMKGWIERCKNTPNS